jgi:hypothetical protein
LAAQILIRAIDPATEKERKGLEWLLYTIVSDVPTAERLQKSRRQSRIASA